jgi:hypothetical protein
VLFPTHPELSTAGTKLHRASVCAVCPASSTPHCSLVAIHALVRPPDHVSHLRWAHIKAWRPGWMGVRFEEGELPAVSWSRLSCLSVQRAEAPCPSSNDAPTSLGVAFLLARQVARDVHLTIESQGMEISAFLSTAKGKVAVELSWRRAVQRHKFPLPPRESTFWAVVAHSDTTWPLLWPWYAHQGSDLRMLLLHSTQDFRVVAGFLFERRLCQTLGGPTSPWTLIQLLGALFQDGTDIFLTVPGKSPPPVADDGKEDAKMRLLTLFEDSRPRAFQTAHYLACVVGLSPAAWPWRCSAYARKHRLVPRPGWEAHFPKKPWAKLDY